MTIDQYLRPAGTVDLSRAPYELAPTVALAELQAALAGWIADGMEAADGWVHDPDREDASQMANSLHLAASVFEKAKCHTSADEPQAQRFQGAAPHLRYAAEQLDSGRLIADPVEPFPYSADVISGYIQAHYGSAVAYIRQASDFFRDGTRDTATVATRTPERLRAR